MNGNKQNCNFMRFLLNKPASDGIMNSQLCGSSSEPTSDEQAGDAAFKPRQVRVCGYIEALDRKMDLDLVILESSVHQDVYSKIKEFQDAIDVLEWNPSLFFKYQEIAFIYGIQGVDNWL